MRGYGEYNPVCSNDFINFNVALDVLVSHLPTNIYIIFNYPEIN